MMDLFNAIKSHPRFGVWAAEWMRWHGGDGTCEKEQRYLVRSTDFVDAFVQTITPQLPLQVSGWQIIAISTGIGEPPLEPTADLGNAAIFYHKFPHNVPVLTVRHAATGAVETIVVDATMQQYFCEPVGCIVEPVECYNARLPCPIFVR